MSTPPAEILPSGITKPAATEAPASKPGTPPPAVPTVNGAGPGPQSLNLATASQAPAPSPSGDHVEKDNIVIFHDDAALKANPVILVDAPAKTFSWTIAQPDVTPNAVVLYAKEFSNSPLPVARVPLMSQDPKDIEQPFISVTNTSAVLNITAFDIGSPKDAWRTQPMRLALIWFRDQEGGISGSDTFAVAKDGKNNTVNELEVTAAGNNVKTAGQYELPHDKGTIGSPPVPRPVNNGTASAGGRGSDDLSTGAIAGIAVGAAIGGLLITGFILWLFFRKRKQTRDRESMLLEEQKARALIDKEEHRSTSAGSPISPYADEKPAARRPESMLPPIPSATPIPAPILKSPTSPIAPPAAPALTHKASQGSVAGSFSSARQEQPRPLSSASGAAARSSPTREVPSSVAHLVEDGMTDADIQRLEEEERQLDLEIARKTKGSRRA